MDAQWSQLKETVASDRFTQLRQLACGTSDRLALVEMRVMAILDDYDVISAGDNLEDVQEQDRAPNAALLLDADFANPDETVDWIEAIDADTEI